MQIPESVPRLSDALSSGPQARPLMVSSDLIWIVLGLTTSVLTAYLLALAHLRFGIALFAYSVGILPVSALGCGMVAATGYGLAARVLGRVPGPLAKACMAVSGLLTFSLIYWFEYSLVEVDGRPLSSLMSFTGFVRSVVGVASVRFMPFNTELAIGRAGYAFATLQAFAFCIAGLAPYFLNVSKLHCDRCGRFLPDRPSAFGYGSPADLARAFVTVSGLASDGAVSSARAHVDSLPRQELNHKLDLETADCARCGRAYYRLRLLEWTLRQTWVPLPAHSVSGYVTTRRLQ